MRTSSVFQARVSDRQLSTAGFSVALAGGGKLEGCFMDFDAALVIKNADFSSSTLKMVLFSDSLKSDTVRHAQRLMGPSCLNVGAYRSITFESTDWVQLSDTEFLLYGMLTMSGKRKLVVFEVTDRGRPIDLHRPHQLTSLEFDGVIKRSDFSLATNVSELNAEDEIVIKAFVVFRNDTAPQRSGKNLSIL